MEIQKIDVDKCFNITSTPRIYERFKPTSEPIYDPHIFEQIVYRCEDCAFEIFFEDKDFQKHSRSNFTNLNQSENEELNNYLKDNDIQIKSFLDFYCPSCKTPTRLFFSDGYGGKHGEYIINIDFGLTIKTS